MDEDNLGALHYVFPVCVTLASQYMIFKRKKQSEPVNFKESNRPLCLASDKTGS